MSLLDSFPHECTISKVNRGRDTIGGSKNTLVTVSTGVECWEQSLNNRESSEYQKRGILDARKVYFNYDPGVTERHEIKVTKRGGVTQSNPISFSVIESATPDASAGLEILWRVMVRDVSGEVQ